MAPKKRTSTDGEAANKHDADLAILANANADWLGKRAGWLSTITKFMPDIIDKDPVDTFLAPYDGDVLKRKVDGLSDRSAKAAFQYTGGGNLMWLDHAMTVSNAVPVNPDKIRQFKEHVALQPGSCIPFTIEVAISHKMGKPINKGKVQKISPDEPIDVVLWTIADSLEKAEPKDKVVVVVVAVVVVVE